MEISVLFLFNPWECCCLELYELYLSLTVTVWVVSEGVIQLPVVDVDCCRCVGLKDCYGWMGVSVCVDQLWVWTSCGCWMEWLLWLDGGECMCGPAVHVEWNDCYGWMGLTTCGCWMEWLLQLGGGECNCWLTVGVFFVKMYHCMVPSALHNCICSQ